jgi:hypothetical protein
MAKFELKPFHKNVTDNDLIDDLKAVASLFEKTNVTWDEYNIHGKFNSVTFNRRFGSWNNALERASLVKLKFMYLSDEELFENIENVWLKLGSQPTHTDMHRPLSKFGGNTDIRHFGSWRKALEKFVEIANSDSDSNTQFVVSEEMKISGRNTPRHPNWRLRYKVLARDGARCRLCGKSSAETTLHVDHIKPWSKGGETTLEKLQVLCDKCNFGKSNLD